MKHLAALCVVWGALAAPAAACTIVFGQGRNASPDDEAADATWDNVNLAFNAQVAARLADTGETVVPLVLRVAATDLPANVDKLLARAAAEGCNRIVETTLFADYESQTLVARLRDHPLQPVPGAGADKPALRIAPPRFVVERQFTLSRSTLDRVRPAALADEMTAELLRR